MADAQAKLKITVVKRIFNEELAAKYGEEAVVPCNVLADGQEFMTDGVTQPEGFCGWAWNDIHKVCLTLLKGGTFAPGWMKDDKSLIACCTDGFRPVVFLVERLEG